MKHQKISTGDRPADYTRAVKRGTPAFVFVLLIVLFFLVLRAAREVPAGHVGVVDLFGKVRAEALPSGLHFLNPLVSVPRLSIQMREMKRRHFAAAAASERALRSTVI